MCGGDLEVTEGMTVCECEYCGSKQTISSVDDEKIIKLYDRANRLRMAN
jgi:DNA-directed RNA polymerase subunit RPC12/RpoP